MSATHQTRLNYNCKMIDYADRRIVLFFHSMTKFATFCNLQLNFMGNKHDSNTFSNDLTHFLWFFFGPFCTKRPGPVGPYFIGTNVKISRSMASVFTFLARQTWQKCAQSPLIQVIDCSKSCGMFCSTIWPFLKSQMCVIFLFAEFWFEQWSPGSNVKHTDLSSEIQIHR